MSMEHEAIPWPVLGPETITNDTVIADSRICWGGEIVAVRLTVWPTVSGVGDAVSDTTSWTAAWAGSAPTRTPLAAAVSTIRVAARRCMSSDHNRDAGG